MDKIRINNEILYLIKKKHTMDSLFFVQNRIIDDRSLKYCKNRPSSTQETAKLYELKQIRNFMNNLKMRNGVKLISKRNKFKETKKKSTQKKLHKK